MNSPKKTEAYRDSRQERRKDCQRMAEDGGFTIDEWYPKPHVVYYDIKSEWKARAKL
jgi:hypothetical protein